MPGREFKKYKMGKEPKSVPTKEPPKPTKKSTHRWYQRERRVDGIPESRSKLDMFLIVKNRDLEDFVKETTEKARDSDDEEMETDQEDSDLEVTESGSGNLENSDEDDFEEDVREMEEDLD